VKKYIGNSYLDFNGEIVFLVIRKIIFITEAENEKDNKFLNSQHELLTYVTKSIEEYATTFDSNSNTKIIHEFFE